MRGAGTGRAQARPGAEPGQPEKGIHRVRHAAPAPAVHPGRTHQRPGPAGTAGILVRAGGPAAGGGHRVPVLPRAVRGPAVLRPSRHHPGGAARGGGHHGGTGHREQIF